MAGQRHGGRRGPAPLPDRPSTGTSSSLRADTERGPRGHGRAGVESHGDPFEACPWNPVFTHRSSIHPVQNVGHADLVQTPDGEWAAVYLGARTRGSTPGFHVLGRETFLAGVDWSDGWPVFDEARFDVPEVDSAFTDRFTDPPTRPAVGRAGR